VKRSKCQRHTFLVVYFWSPYYQERLLDEKLGWNHFGTNYLSPLCNVLEWTLKNYCCLKFSGQRLWHSRSEAPSLSGRRLWSWARDSGQRVRPPQLDFWLSGACLYCRSRVSRDPVRRLRCCAPRGPETLALTGQRFQVAPETSTLTGQRLWG
jgi:hypothetical protein